MFFGFVLAVAVTGSTKSCAAVISSVSTLVDSVWITLIDGFSESINCKVLVRFVSFLSDSKARSCVEIVPKVLVVVLMEVVLVRNGVLFTVEATVLVYGNDSPFNPVSRTVFAMLLLLFEVKMLTVAVMAVFAVVACCRILLRASSNPRTYCSCCSLTDKSDVPFPRRYCFGVGVALPAVAKIILSNSGESSFNNFKSGEVRRALLLLSCFLTLLGKSSFRLFLSYLDIIKLSSLLKSFLSFS